MLSASFILVCTAIMLMLSAVMTVSISFAAGLIVYQWSIEKRPASRSAYRQRTGVEEFYDTPDGKKHIPVEPTEDEIKLWMSQIED